MNFFAGAGTALKNFARQAIHHFYNARPAEAKAAGSSLFFV